MESESDNNEFINLLSIPILRRQIFEYLPFKVIFSLRGVSSEMKFIIDEDYLPELRIINFGITKPRWVSGGKHEKDQRGFKVISTQTRSLRTLNLSYCDWLTDDLLIETLQSNPYLNELNISGCTKLTSIAFYSIIAHGPNVKVLNITDCRFQFLSLDEIELEGFKFEELEVSINYYSNTYLNGLLRKSEHLQRLTLQTDNIMRKEKGIVSDALGHCKDLKTLILKNGCNITDDEFYRFSYLPSCKNIECLSLIECINITDRALKAIRNFDNLKQLILDGCFTITAKGIRYLTVCENIQILSLNNCRWVDDTVLETLSRYRNLKKLYLLSDFVQYTDAGIGNLVNGCSSLKEVFLSGKCNNIPQDCFRLLKVDIHILEEARYTPSYRPKWYSCKGHGRVDNMITKF